VQVGQEEIDSTDPSAHFESLVKQRIRELAQSKDKFGFQVYKEQGPEGEKYAIKFGQYSLAGGGGEPFYVGKDGKLYRKLSEKRRFAMGASLVGWAMIGTVLGGPVGGAVCFCGVGKFYDYVVNTPVREKTDRGAKQALAIGAVAGGVGVAAAAAAKSVNGLLCISQLIQ